MALFAAEKALRKLAERKEKMNRRRTLKALAMGFSCPEEMEQTQMREWRQQELREEEYIKKQCAITGQTRKQYAATLYQDNSEPQVNNLLPMTEACDCEAHAIPLFCPKSLVEYRSQDLPALLSYVCSRHLLRPEELKIEDGDKSRRLNQETLEKYWTQKSQGIPIDIPFWAKADEVVQKIIHQDAHRTASVSHASPTVHTPSLLYDESAKGSSPSENIKDISINVSAEVKSGSQEHHIIYNSETPFSEGYGVPTVGFSKERGQVGQAGKRTSRCPKAPAKPPGWDTGRGSRVTKVSWKPAMGLRCRKITRFYRLD